MVEIIEGLPKTKYGFIEPSWNPIVGCTHQCTYCWAKDNYNRKSGTRYKKRNFLEPELIYERLGRTKLISELKRVKKNSWIFVCVMGDLFCDNKVIRNKDVQWILKAMEERMDLNYLFVTKNPRGYLNYRFPPKSYLGITIETNEEKIAKKFSQAPTPYERYITFKKIRQSNKFLALGPLLDFDEDILMKWIIDTDPKVIAIGFDEHPRSINETMQYRPSNAKLVKFIRGLKRQFKNTDKRIYLCGEVAALCKKDGLITRSAPLMPNAKEDFCLVNAD